MKLRALAAIGVMAVLTVACAGDGNRITYTEHSNFYSPQLVQYVSNKGYFPLTMHGAPFGPEGNGKIAQNLRLPGYYKSVPFKEVSGQSSDDLGRLVLLMDAGGIVNGSKLCHDLDKLALNGNQGEKLQIQASFCYQDEMVSHAVLTTLRPKSADDPDFQRGMRQLTEDLFRTQLPEGPGCSAAGGSC